MKYKNIELAPQVKINKYGDFVDKFLKDVFDLEEGSLVTDLSSLYDYDFDLDAEERMVVHHTEEYLKKINYLYNMDVSDVEGLILVDIFDKILGGD